MNKRVTVVLVLALVATFGIAVADESPNAGVTSPYLIADSRIAPEYPPAAFDARLDGSVVVAALVLTDGSVAHVESLESSAPNLGFEEATAAAVKQWEFEPATKDGEPVDAFTVVRLNFRHAGGSSASGYVSAGFLPLESMSSSIVAEMGNAAGAADAGGFSLSSSQSGYTHAVGRLPSELYDPKSVSGWVPERELRLDESKTPANAGPPGLQKK